MSLILAGPSPVSDLAGLMDLFPTMGFEGFRPAGAVAVKGFTGQVALPGSQGKTANLGDLPREGPGRTEKDVPSRRQRITAFASGLNQALVVFGR
jgi:hypothetical protein